MCFRVRVGKNMFLVELTLQSWKNHDFWPKHKNYQILSTLILSFNFGGNWVIHTWKLGFYQFFQLCISFSNSVQTYMFCTFRHTSFLNRSWWKAEIFTDYIDWADKLIIWVAVIIVGKMAEQSWKILKFLNFCWTSTKGLAISKRFKMEGWNFYRL